VLVRRCHCCDCGRGLFGLFWRRRGPRDLAHALRGWPLAAPYTQPQASTSKHKQASEVARLRYTCAALTWRQRTRRAAARCARVMRALCAESVCRVVTACRRSPRSRSELQASAQPQTQTATVHIVTVTLHSLNPSLSFCLCDSCLLVLACLCNFARLLVLACSSTPASLSVSVRARARARVRVCACACLRP
jgi:hypothetical protein